MHELQDLEDNKKIGNVKFTAHFKNGVISHINCDLDKCIRMESEVTNARQ